MRRPGALLRRLRRAAATLACAGLLGGCAALRPGADTAEEAKKAPPPAVQLKVEAPAPLAALLQTNLDLSRLRGVADEPISEVELQRLVAAAPAQARSLLETEGYFEPAITMSREPGSPAQVVMRVEPGPRTTVEHLSFEVQGELERAAAGGDDAARELIGKLQNDWPLKPGEPFRNAQWSAAKSSTLAQLRSAGYAGATWSGTGAQVDVRTQHARLFVVADSGPLYRTGELVIQGLERQSEETVRNLAGFGPGTPATETLLLDYQERLQKTGLYDRVVVSIDPQPGQAQAVPVTVRLRELPLQQATFGVGISANVGPRLEVEHVHRRAFGQRATARNKFDWGRLRQAWEGELSSHAQPGFYRNLIGGAAERIESDADTVTSARLRIGRTQDSKRIDRLGFAQIERATVRTATTREQADALSLNYHVVWRRVDSILLPTDGVSLALESAIGRASSSAAPPGPFGRAYGRLYVWRPLGSWYGQARLELGQVFVRNAVAVPDPQLFRAGGDDSVRGYAYRSLGPPGPDGAVSSGRVLATGSLEIARPISAKLPAVWWAAFVDAGNAADRWGDLKPALGVGLGLRWRSPVGPLRIDGAWGEQTRRFRLHLSVGIAF